MSQIKLTYGIPRNITIASLPLSDWTIVNTNTISVNGDTITQLGIAGWYESMYVSFTVPETKKYEISYDYNITTAQVGNHGIYGFGLWLTSNDPNVSDEAQRLFYANTDNRHGNLIGSINENLSGKSGTEKFSITLNANTTYYLWYPGAALEDGVTQTLSFTNIKISDVNYDFNNTLILPNQTDHLEYNIPSGTYVDILYQNTEGIGAHEGTLSGNIYDYDMIKIYQRSIGASGECCMGTEYCPKDIPLTGGRPFLYSQFGAGNFYLNASTITFNNGTAFTSTGFNTYPCMNQATTATAGSTATFGRNNTYAQDNSCVHMIIGEKYYDNRDLLFSASTTASLPQTINLNNPYSAYDRLQIKIATNAEQDPTHPEYVGYWTEHHSIQNGSVKITLEAGTYAFYYYQFVGGWDDATTLKMNVAKALTWSTINTGAVGVNTAYTGLFYVSEIWGIKE